MAMTTGSVIEATRIGNELSVVVLLPDGVTQRYSVSLLDPNIKASIEAAARQTSAPSNDARIKANLSLVVKGLQLDLGDTEPPDPPDPPDPVVTQFLVDLRALHQAVRLDVDKLTVDGIDLATSRAVVQDALNRDPALARLIGSF